jgi:nucleoside-diphosphate-sugar epimerase
MRAAIAAGERVGVMFGGEKSGLPNEAVTMADAIITLPVDRSFSSLNLAQAIAVIAYEWKAEEAPPAEFEPVSDIAKREDLERMFEHFASVHGTRVALIRLSYAIDMRYGVLHDVANAVQQGEPVQIDSGHCNVIWQGDANDITLQSLAYADNPPFVLNLSGPELVNVRSLAQKFGEFFGKEPVLEGSEQAPGQRRKTGPERARRRRATQRRRAPAFSTLPRRSLRRKD